MGLFKRKRKFVRISKPFYINYQIANEVLRPGYLSKDISEWGIRFSLYQELQIGTSLKLYIYLEDCVEL